MPTADGQYHCDEFIGEVIGIDLLRSFAITLPPDTAEPGEPVTANIGMGRVGSYRTFVGEGKTMGFALASVREQIRQHYGR